MASAAAPRGTHAPTLVAAVAHAHSGTLLTYTIQEVNAQALTKKSVPQIHDMYGYTPDAPWSICMRRYE